MRWPAGTPNPTSLQGRYSPDPQPKPAHEHDWQTWTSGGHPISIRTCRGCKAIENTDDGWAYPRAEA